MRRYTTHRWGEFFCLTGRGLSDNTTCNGQWKRSRPGRLGGKHMSVVVTRSRRDLLIPWVNELIILCPSHPGSVHAGKPMPSHAISVVTVFINGLKGGDTLENQKADWQLGIAQRGQIDEESLYENLDLCNKSLYSHKDPRHAFFNQILSLTKTKRKIEAVPGSKPRTHLFLRGILQPGSAIAARVLAKKDFNVTYFEDLGCTKIRIKGSGPRSQVMRFLYRHTKPVVRPPEPPTYGTDQFPNSRFPVEEIFEIYSFHKVLDNIESGIADNDDAAELFNTEIRECMIQPSEVGFVQDLVVVGDPEAFRYEFLASQLASVETGVQGMDRWISLNGQPPVKSYVSVYEVFPKKAFRTSPDSFSMRVSARLSCMTCRKFIIDEEHKVLATKVEKQGEDIRTLQDRVDKLSSGGKDKT